PPPRPTLFPYTTLFRSRAAEPSRARSPAAPSMATTSGSGATAARSACVPSGAVQPVAAMMIAASAAMPYRSRVMSLHTCARAVRFYGNDHDPVTSAVEPGAGGGAGTEGVG